ncbi:MAG: DsbE family thiol:disulfide interchange protein [Gammaproteobacteria bacterium]|nr:DsbE family thiol:disulfide interchange protein [Gammaproteobacteria bacterium]
MFRALIPAFMFAILIVFFWTGLSLDPSKVPSPLIGKPVPAFELPRLSVPEQTLSSEQLQGQVSLFNVWATWCVGCRQEHDMLLAIADENLVPIYGLNYKDEREAALRWLRELGDPYAATAVDADGRVSIDWGVYGAPETFLIDRDGIVRYKHIGPLSAEDWENELRPRIQSLLDSSP